MGLSRSYLQKPPICGTYGGGGNRTRVGCSEETAAVQALRIRTASAYRAEPSLVDHFSRACLARLEEMLAGRDTNIYVVIDPAADALKIGLGDNVELRVGGLQVGNCNPLYLFAACPGTPALERLMHEVLSRYRIRGEWFRADPEVLAIAELILSAGQVCSDILASGDNPAAEDTVYLMIGHLEEMAA